MQTAAPGKAPERRTAFDAAERARIRAALLRYMEEHRIGVPTLQGRIAKASGRSTDLIPLKTLQRFLADSHRTNDAFLVPVDQFAQTLPAPPADEFSALAKSLGAFYAAPQGDAEPAPESGPRLLGAFEVHEKEASSRGDSPDHPPPAGTMTFDEKAFTPAVLIREFEYLQSGDPAPASPAHVYEGVLMPLRLFQVGVLRSTLTRLPRIHWFAIGRSFSLQSFCQSAATQHTFPAPPILPPRTLYLRPVTAAPAKP